MTFLGDAVDASTRHDAAAGPAIDHRFVARLLHWLIAALVGAMVASGVAMTQLGSGGVADFLFSAHKMTGVGILVLVAIRWTLRLAMRLRGQWRAQTRHRWTHGLLYAFLFAVPLMGWAGVSDFGARTVLFGLELPAIWPEGAGWSHLLLRTHAWLAFGMLGFVCLHIGLALEVYLMRNSVRRDEETIR